MMTPDERRRLIEAPLCIRTIGSNALGAPGLLTLNTIADQRMIVDGFTKHALSPEDLELFLLEADEKDIARWKREEAKRKAREDFQAARMERVRARNRAATAARVLAAKERRDE